MVPAPLVLRSTVRTFRTLCIAAVLCCGCLLPRPNPEPIDRADLTPTITHIRGHVYLVEDHNYWKTNSVIFAHPDGIAFFDAGYTPATAARMIWKATAHSEARYAGLILTDFQLHRSGGIAQFEQEVVPIYMHEKTARLLQQNWQTLQKSMADSFASWRLMPSAGPDGLFDKRIDILGGLVQVSFPGHAQNPGNLVVYFRDERILFAGSLLAKPAYFLDYADPEGYPAAYRTMEQLGAEILISGHGQALYGPELLPQALLDARQRLRLQRPAREN